MRTLAQAVWLSLERHNASSRPRSHLASNDDRKRCEEAGPKGEEPGFDRVAER